MLIRPVISRDTRLSRHLLTGTKGQMPMSEQYVGFSEYPVVKELSQFCFKLRLFFFSHESNVKLLPNEPTSHFWDQTGKPVPQSSLVLEASVDTSTQDVSFSLADLPPSIHSVGVLWYFTIDVEGVWKMRPTVYPVRKDKIDYDSELPVSQWASGTVARTIQPRAKPSTKSPAKTSLKAPAEPLAKPPLAKSKRGGQHVGAGRKLLTPKSGGRRGGKRRSTLARDANQASSDVDLTTAQLQAEETCPQSNDPPQSHGDNEDVNLIACHEGSATSKSQVDLTPQRPPHRVMGPPSTLRMAAPPSVGTPSRMSPMDPRQWLRQQPNWSLPSTPLNTPQSHFSHSSTLNLGAGRMPSFGAASVKDIHERSSIQLREAAILSNGTSASQQNILPSGRPLFPTARLSDESMSATDDDEDDQSVASGSRSQERLDSGASESCSEIDFGGDDDHCDEGKSATSCTSASIPQTQVPSAFDTSVQGTKRPGIPGNDSPSKRSRTEGFQDIS